MAKIILQTDLGGTKHIYQSYLCVEGDHVVECVYRNAGIHGGGDEHQVTHRQRLHVHLEGKRTDYKVLYKFIPLTIYILQ